MATYMLLLHEDPRALATSMPPAEMERVVAEYRAWAEKLATAGRLIGGEKLKDEGGKVLSTSSGKLRVVDGPFAEAKEVIGGYFTITADSYAHAVELCSDHPHLRHGRRIELREIEPT
jgi:hypothetical protein